MAIFIRGGQLLHKPPNEDCGCYERITQNLKRDRIQIVGLGRRYNSDGTVTDGLVAIVAPVELRSKQHIGLMTFDYCPWCGRKMTGGLNGKA